MACRRSARALGGVRALGSGKAIPQGPRTQTDSHPSQRTGSVGSFQDGGCQTQKGVVEWVTREPLLSTESRAIPFHGGAHLSTSFENRLVANQEVSRVARASTPFSTLHRP